MKIIPADSEIFNGLDTSALNTLPSKDSQFVVISSLSDVINWQSVEPTMLNERTLVVGQNLSPRDILEIMSRTSIRSVVQRRDPCFIDDLVFAQRLQSSKQSYFSSRGQEVEASANLVFEYSFRQTTDKSNLFKELYSFCETLKSQSLLDSVIATVEELYMNAIFDAPNEYSSSGFSDFRVYNEATCAWIRIYRSSRRLVVTCEDPFGSLDAGKLQRRMDLVYRVGAGESINLTGRGGAGLGCALIFENCESLFVGVSRGQSTIVTCLFPIGLSHRQRNVIPKSLHFIEL